MLIAGKSLHEWADTPGIGKFGNAVRESGIDPLWGLGDDVKKFSVRVDYTYTEKFDESIIYVVAAKDEDDAEEEAEKRFCKDKSLEENAKFQGATVEEAEEE